MARLMVKEPLTDPYYLILRGFNTRQGQNLSLQYHISISTMAFKDTFLVFSLLTVLDPEEKRK
ncbi:hypothetical protein E2C01_034728 [Portunus trituberculatus]|uniref:Uncharacterized protein n=1 Tax=Portunus trituberculatus TaxID=210409 RepID=A0A5B7F7S7_PORTR|nr:hypothetical protein [Portunus trituberculatus]